MAGALPVRPDLIASRYSEIGGGPRLLYSFETQTGIPIDGGNPLLRQLSPFTISLIPPELDFVNGAGTSGLGRAYGSSFSQALSSVSSNQATAAAVASSGDTASVTQNPSLYSIQRAVASGIELGTTSSFNTINTFADGYTALDILAQVEAMKKIPPLTLLVNPTEMTTSYSTVQNFGTRSREGLIFQRWGEQLRTLNFTGSTGAFIAGVAPAGDPLRASSLNPLTEGSVLTPKSPETPSVSGFQFASKRDSAAWQNFISLYQFYRNNGYIYDTFGRSEAHLMQGCVSINYDQITYYGHIDSFNYSYTADSPNRILWDMNFTVTRMVDAAQASTVVLPMKGPTESPSNYPNRQSRNNTTTFSFGVSASSTAREILGETPLDLLLPSGTLL